MLGGLLTNSLLVIYKRSWNSFNASWSIDGTNLSQGSTFFTRKGIQSLSPSTDIMPRIRIPGCLFENDQSGRNHEWCYETTVVLWFAAEGKAEFTGCLGLLRPHFTVISSPSISKPWDQAWAAVSATARSLKLTNAHLSYDQSEQLLK